MKYLIAIGYSIFLSACCSVNESKAVEQSVIDEDFQKKQLEEAIRIMDERLHGSSGIGETVMRRPEPDGAGQPDNPPVKL